MNQTFDIALSFIIGGMVLFSIVALSLHFSSKSQEIKLAEMTQRSVLGTGSVIDYDFRKLGYGDNVDSSIVSIGNKAIVFKSDLDNNGTINRISYSQVRENGLNYLRRSIDNNQAKTWKVPIADFSVFGISANGDTTQVIAGIKSILVEVRLSPKSIGGDSLSVGVFWKRQFFPKNL